MFRKHLCFLEITSTTPTDSREKQCDDMEIDENVKAVVLNQKDRKSNISKFNLYEIGRFYVFLFIYHVIVLYSYVTLNANTATGP